MPRENVLLFHRTFCTKIRPVRFFFLARERALILETAGDFSKFHFYEVSQVDR